MTKRGEFNADEWSTVVQAPALAAAQVMTAERGGTLREAASLARTYKEARAEHGSELVEAVVSESPRIEPAEVRSPDALAEHTRQQLHAATDIVRRHATPEELDDYRRFILSVARAVARAHKEGGFLGIGGKEISDKEQAAIDAIIDALDDPAP
jgi:hypothetical protein